MLTLPFISCGSSFCLGFFSQQVMSKCGTFNEGGCKILVPVCVPAWCGCAGEAEEVAAAAGAQDS